MTIHMTAKTIITMLASPMMSNRARICENVSFISIGLFKGTVGVGEGDGFGVGLIVGVGSGSGSCMGGWVGSGVVKL